MIPGFIDAHAHWDGYDTIYPAKSWEQETFLAHGVTTLHKYVEMLFTDESAEIEIALALVLITLPPMWNVAW